MPDGIKKKTPAIVSSAPKLSSMQMATNLGKSLLGAMASYEKPTLSNAMIGIGSLMGSPVLLATAQSVHDYRLSTLLGAKNIDLKIRYISDSFYKGAFGIDRRCSFEKQFYYLGGGNYRLDLDDGRWFRFIKDEDGTFIDVGSLGVEIVERGSNSYELHYWNGSIELYQENYLIEQKDSNGNAILLSYKDILTQS